MGPLHEAIKRLLKGFAVLSRLTIPVHFVLFSVFVLFIT